MFIRREKTVNPISTVKIMSEFFRKLSETSCFSVEVISDRIHSPKINGCLIIVSFRKRAVKVTVHWKFI